MAVGGDFNGDGCRLLSRHTFGPPLILLFTTIVPFPDLRICGLFLLPGQFDSQLLNEHQHSSRHRKGKQGSDDAQQDASCQQ